MSKFFVFVLFLLTGSASLDAVDFKTIEPDWIENNAEFSTHTFVLNAASSFTVEGYMNWYIIQAVGANSTYRIDFTTSNLEGSKVHQSSATTLLSGQNISREVRGLMWHPKIIIRSLGSGGTTYVKMGYIGPERLFR